MHKRIGTPPCTLRQSRVSVRGDLAKEVRKAKYSKDIVKYGTDQNGKITVKVKIFSPWVEVTSISHLQHLVANPPVSERPRQAWGQQHGQQ